MRAWTPNETVEIAFDETKEHRLKLTCTWDDELPRCLYIMLNPSTADTETCDRTLGRCISLAKENGFGSIVVVNLFSLRTANVNELRNTEVCNHPDNMPIVQQAIDEAETVIAAWGSNLQQKSDSSWVIEQASKRGKSIYCFLKNKTNTPKHPLYVKSGTKLQLFD